MNPVSRILVGALAVFILWMLARALRRGTIFSRGVGYDINSQPMMFALIVSSQVFGVCLFAWLAAGGDIAAFWRMAMPHWLSSPRL